MFIPSEKIAPRRRRQIFNNYADEGTVQERDEENDRWVKKLVNGLAGLIRKIIK
jgi:hypothetical protein